MAAFETIGEVAVNYHMDAAQLLTDLRKAARQKGRGARRK